MKKKTKAQQRAQAAKTKEQRNDWDKRTYSKYLVYLRNEEDKEVIEYLNDLHDQKGMTLRKIISEALMAHKDAEERKNYITF